MKIADKTVVKMHYSVLDGEGNLIDSSYEGEPLEFLHGTKYLLEDLENALNDKAAGDTFEVSIPADNAYGQRIDGLVQKIESKMFTEFEVEVGMQLRAGTDNGEQTVIVIDKTDDYVTVDGNHPLAGIDLKFDVEILDVRAATEEELSHGHVHSAGGCGHSH
ncbi:peptidylprolyl isomerase [Psychrosphaera sp. F3M07]|uniref:FKBP-type peptidyl-prolyl cis-trans isomerase n=1 Tax=Psychrosphaera sp. F3M07 TaxID=2841560 RepID=UPI001C091D07|nr:peptidylprolyl isomerase [Psychrosphaera sp. F3M07]MBU2916673.1 peptidylprolyl isomerase [Psychrosphaera sp. F3M07]